MTTMVVGYKLIKASDESVVQQWGGIWGIKPEPPPMIKIPSKLLDVHVPEIGVEYGMDEGEDGQPIVGTGYELIEWVMEEPPPPDPIPVNEISDRQFFQQLAIAGVITEAEALAAVQTGTIPAALLTFIETMPVEDQFAAKMLVSGAVIFKRDHPMTGALAEGMQWTDEQLNGLWEAASQL